jgi:hypothetical protein
MADTKRKDWTMYYMRSEVQAVKEKGGFLKDVFELVLHSISSRI